jgi:hypothetical protein
MLKSKSFEKWTQQELKKQFHLTSVPQSAELQHWLDLALPPTLALTKIERQLLQEAQIEAIKYVDTWTEQELVIHYISLIIRFAKLHQGYYQAFANRYLKATVDDQILHGWVDFMVQQANLSLNRLISASMNINELAQAMNLTP